MLNFIYCIFQCCHVECFAFIPLLYFWTTLMLCDGNVLLPLLSDMLVHKSKKKIMMITMLSLSGGDNDIDYTNNVTNPRFH